MTPLASSQRVILARLCLTSAVCWGTLVWCGCIAAVHNGVVVALSVLGLATLGAASVWAGTRIRGTFGLLLVNGLVPFAFVLGVCWPALMVAWIYPGEETLGLAKMYVAFTACFAVALAVAVNLLARSQSPTKSKWGLETVNFGSVLLLSIVGVACFHATARYSVPLVPLLLSVLLCIDSGWRDWRCQRWLNEVRHGRVRGWSVRASVKADMQAPALFEHPLLVRDAVVVFENASGPTYRVTATQNALSVDQAGMTEQLIRARILRFCGLATMSVCLSVGTFGFRHKVLLTKDRALEDLMSHVPQRMLKIPEGTFRMGGLWGDETPRHSLHVEAFEIDETEVTVEDYEKCVRAQACNADSLSDPDVKRCNWGNNARHNHPINCVNWHQADAYCRWAGKRLPSEVEWEYAATGDLPPEETDETVDICAQILGQEHTCRVGAYPQKRSPFGLLDTIGNVWEWTSSPYCSYPEHDCTRQTLVFRGGGWGGRGPWRTTNRNHDRSSERDFDLGFRCVRGGADADAQARAHAFEDPSSEKELGPSASITGEMVRIPAGSFEMGSVDGNADELPVHEVNVDSFEMDKTEVRVAAYRACVESGQCEVTNYGLNVPANVDEKDATRFRAFCNWGKNGRDLYPMNCVDFDSAEAFCRWAGKKLPTEEQWEYAARGSDGRRYPWGNLAPNGQLLNACGRECKQLGAAWGWTWKSMHDEADPWPETAPVGSFPSGASAYGLLDMAGNVSEWTSSTHSASYGKIGDPHRRVRRGSDWFGSNPSVVRATSRLWSAAEAKSFTIGFRCAR